MQESKSTTPSPRKVRRDYGGGKRGNGHKRTKPIRRPDPRKIHVKGGAKSLSSVAGLVMFGAFLRAVGVDRRLRELFHDMKHPELTIYPMGAQLRLLLDLVVAGEDRVFGLDDLAFRSAVRSARVTAGGGGCETHAQDVLRLSVSLVAKEK
jgi:hypothetical protein